MQRSRYYESQKPRDPHAPTPYVDSRFYDFERYSIQNMLLQSVNAPDKLRKGYEGYSVWSDRSMAAWDACSEGLKSTKLGDAFWNGVLGPDLLAFAQAMGRHPSIGIPSKVVGARIVRFSRDGYPIYRLDLVYPRSETR